MKKVLALLLSLAMMTALFAGCSQEDNTPPAKVPTEILGVTVQPGGRLESILSSGQITMVMSPRYAPYEFIDLSNPTGGQERFLGADIDLAYYVADKLGVELIIDDMDFNGVLASITEGKYDMAISGLDAKEDRMTAMDFTQPYDPAVLDVVVVRAEDFDKYKSVEDLNNADIQLGILIGSTHQTLAAELFPEVQAADGFVFVNTPPDAVPELRTGKIDGIICSEPSANGFVGRYDDIVMADFNLGNTDSGASIAVPKNSEDLVEVLNLIIDDVLEQGLFEQWLVAAKELSDAQQSLD